VVALALFFAAGLGGWTLLEYVIHGVLSHRFRTFVSGLHNVHHRDPHAVFTARAWLPVATIALVSIALLGFGPATVSLLGLVSGFIVYEVVHYRIHFARPENRVESALRIRHLAHHACSPDAFFGVTSPFWDRVFGTEPAPARWEEMQQAVNEISVLAGSTNWRRCLEVLKRPQISA
jgi:sterol desaturase/sphingolipid hydroxylase (fatty acid hydroxylase superfamily)